MSTLLPPHSTLMERGLAAAAARVSDTPVPIRTLHRHLDCPLPWLVWLAWAMATPVWLDGWSEAEQRAVVGAAPALNAARGTPQGLRDAVTLAVGETPDLVEYSALNVLLPRAGMHHQAGSVRAGRLRPWAMFEVELTALTTPAAVARVAAVVEAMRPARSWPVLVQVSEVDEAAVTLFGVVGSTAEMGFTPRAGMHHQAGSVRAGVNWTAL